MEYHIRNVDNTLILVTGRPVKIPGFEDYAFFYRKDDGYFIISEVSTGKCVCVAETLRQARADATSRLTRYADKFAELVKEGTIK